MRSSACRFGLSIWVGLLAAGCGGAATSPPSGTSDASASAGPLDPCSLIATSDAKQALGEAVDNAKKSDVAVVNGCMWDATAVIGDLVSVDVNDPTSFTAAETASPGQGFTIEKISGLGDDAFYETTGPNSLLEVRKGNIVISVNVIRNGSADKAAEKQVATIAVGNLH